MIRLDKYLADTGAASRREAKAYIRRGEVTVDGVPARAPEQKIAETAVVCLRGQILRYQAYHYYMLHKPAGVLTATADRSQPTVLDLFPPELQRFGLVPAGRLDKDTTGLLLITDDGDYVHRVITPKKHVPKVYFARTDGLPTSADAERFAQGVVLGDGTQCLPARLECLPEQGGCRVTVGGEVKFACVDGPDFDGDLVDFDEAMARGTMYRPFEAHAREAACNLFKTQEGM